MRRGKAVLVQFILEGVYTHDFTCHHFAEGNGIANVLRLGGLRMKCRDEGECIT